ncbi:MAG: peptidase M75 [Ignavibacteriae bacterium]|nr:peptidase M75 [Ignavibacteriota bacterium]MCB9214246.1 peptidase M75 [Ignavibacteria bacterium]
MTLQRLLSTLALLALVFGLTSCSEDSPTGGQETEYEVYLNDFSFKVVVATYNDMRQKGEVLDQAVESFAADPSNQSKLDAACAAWRGMREPWEAGEAFLFGPAEFLSLDPSIDSWPVDRQQLQDVLDSEFDLTPEFIAEGLGPALRGFHTVEFLLFDNGSPRNVSTYTEREREYLVAVVQVLADDAARLAAAWEDGFAQEFANAGKSGSRYRNQTDAVVEIIEGMSGICDEVANGKIADPFDEVDTRLVESQFSWNSLDDFTNNIRSVQNAYTGGYHNGDDGKGIDELVAEKDAALDARLKSEIEAAIAAIGQIPAPFRDNLTATAQIEAAQAAVLKVFNTIENDVKPLFVN